MRKVHILTTPIKATDLTFADEFEDEITQPWQQKARALQTRRWRALKRSMKGDRHANR